MDSSLYRVKEHHGGRSIMPIGLRLAKKRYLISRYTRAGLRFFSSEPQEQIIFSGIQPTGVPHLGNYLGALQQWVKLQNQAASSARFLYSIVDLHALTTEQDAERLRRCKRETLATLLAVGLDPARCIIFFQSAVWYTCGRYSTHDKPLSLTRPRFRSTQS